MNSFPLSCLSFSCYIRQRASFHLRDTTKLILLCSSSFSGLSSLSIGFLQEKLLLFLSFLRTKNRPPLAVSLPSFLLRVALTFVLVAFARRFMPLFHNFSGTWQKTLPAMVFPSSSFRKLFARFLRPLPWVSLPSWRWGWPGFAWLARLLERTAGEEVGEEKVEGRRRRGLQGEGGRGAGKACNIIEGGIFPLSPCRHGGSVGRSAGKGAKLSLFVVVNNYSLLLPFGPLLLVFVGLPKLDRPLLFFPADSGDGGGGKKGKTSTNAPKDCLSIVLLSPFSFFALFFSLLRAATASLQCARRKRRSC